MVEQKQQEEILHVPSQDIEAAIPMDVFLQMVSQRGELMEKVKEMAIKVTNNSDWVDQHGTPYLTGSGVEKVRTRFMLKVWGLECKRHNEADTNGNYYYFEYTGKFGWNEKEYIEALGTCSSRDQFFSTKSGKPIDQADVDITNIQKSAYTNLMVNGITRFLGMRSLTWEELKPFGIDKSKTKSITYLSGAKSQNWTDEQSKRAKRIGNFLLANADGDKKLAAETLQELTTFEKDNKIIKGKDQLKNLTGKQVDVNFNKLKKDIEEFEGVGEGDADETQDNR